MQKQVKEKGENVMDSFYTYANRRLKLLPGDVKSYKTDMNNFFYLVQTKLKELPMVDQVLIFLQWDTAQSEGWDMNQEDSPLNAFDEEL